MEYFSAQREPEALGEVVNPGGARSDVEAHRWRRAEEAPIGSAYIAMLVAPRRGARSLSRRRPPTGEREPPRTRPLARLQRLWERFNGAGQTLDVIPVSNDPGSGDEVVLRDDRPVPEDVDQPRWRAGSPGPPRYPAHGAAGSSELRPGILARVRWSACLPGRADRRSADRRARAAPARPVAAPAHTRLAGALPDDADPRRDALGVHSGSAFSTSASSSSRTRIAGPSGR